MAHPFLALSPSASLAALAPALETKRHVFISHAWREASATATVLASQLALRGVRVWPGDSMPLGMHARVQLSDAFVLVLSRSTLAEPSCQAQIKAAISGGKQVQLLLEADSAFAAFDEAAWESSAGDAVRCVEGARGEQVEVPLVVCRMVDEQLPQAVVVRRCGHEVETMVEELCVRIGLSLPRALRRRWLAHRQTPVSVAFIAAPPAPHPAAGGEAVQTAEDIRAELVASGRIVIVGAEAAAERVLLLLSAGVLREGSRSLQRLQKALQADLQAGKERLVVVCSAAAGWDPAGDEHRAAPEVVRDVLGRRRAIVYRPSDQGGRCQHEHPAMIDELLRRLVDPADDEPATSMSANPGVRTGTFKTSSNRSTTYVPRRGALGSAISGTAPPSYPATSKAVTTHTDIMDRAEANIASLLEAYLERQTIHWSEDHPDTKVRNCRRQQHWERLAVVHASAAWTAAVAARSCCYTLRSAQRQVMKAAEVATRRRMRHAVARLQRVCRRFLQQCREYRLLLAEQELEKQLAGALEEQSAKDAAEAAEDAARSKAAFARLASTPSLSSNSTATTAARLTQLMDDEALRPSVLKEALGKASHDIARERVRLPVRDCPMAAQPGTEGQQRTEGEEVVLAPSLREKHGLRTGQLAVVTKVYRGGNINVRRESDSKGCGPFRRADLAKAAEGALPLHYGAFRGLSAKALDVLITAYPEAARIPDTFGRLPLHWLAMSVGNRYAEPFRVLLNAYPAAASLPDASGQLAQTLAVRSDCCRAVLLMLMLASEQVGMSHPSDVITLSPWPCRRRDHSAVVILALK